MKIQPEAPRQRRPSISWASCPTPAGAFLGNRPILILKGSKLLCRETSFMIPIARRSLKNCHTILALEGAGAPINRGNSFGMPPGVGQGNDHG